MGGAQQELRGPDFRAGIALDSLADGVPLLGHADGEAVLMTRFGSDVTAVGATCTHYGGPLADGVVIADTVRCPWHHACFSLRTGEASKAPALNPLPTWTVQIANGRVVVTGKEERDPLAPSFPSRGRETPRSIAVIGLGAAGSAAIEMLRRCGYSGTITAIDEDADAPYDRPNLSKDYLAGNAPEEWIPLRPPGFFEQHGVSIVRGRVTRLDVPTRTVTVEGNANVQFDRLLLATGAEPILLPIPGADLPHVYRLRSLADSRRIIKAIENKKDVVVIGASFIGLEAAAAIRTRGATAHVVAPETLPLERILGSELGTFVRDLHAEKGINFHLGRKPAAIDATTVTLDDGTALPAEVVVMGVGVRPRLDLATAAGLAIDRGVLVNEFLETSAPGIYAAGDIARFPDSDSGQAVRIEHWVVAQRMGQTVARNMLGAQEPFRDVPFFWSAHYDASINYVGHAERFERAVVSGSAADRDVAVRLEDAGGKLLALATIFRDTESLAAEVEMENRRR